MKTFIWVVLFIFLLVGEIECIIKFVNSDFRPSYKREAIYGISIITGVGCIVGYFNIPDTK